jgi:hypothetical protein
MMWRRKALFPKYLKRMFPIQRRAIFFKVKEAKGLGGGVHCWYVAQPILQADAEIGKKGRF